MVKNEKQDHMALIAIVAMVAIVALFLLMSKSGTTTTNSDLAGQAIKAEITTTGESPNEAWVPPCTDKDDDCDGKVDNPYESPEVSQTICSDSDDGKYPNQLYERSQTSGSNGVYYDFCESNQLLGERICNGNEVITEFYICECEQGKCMENSKMWPRQWKV